MALKPEIQYVGQFYSHGSAAQQVQMPKEKDLEKKEYTLPLLRTQQIHRVFVEPLAICSILLSMVLLAAMVFGTMQIQSAWREMEVAEQYVQSLEKVNRIQGNAFYSRVDLEQVRAQALEMGMVPLEELQTVSVSVTVPQPKAEPTQWELFTWFVNGLFA